MIDVYFWPTPNGHKITIFCEEAGTPYRIVPVNIGRGDQFKPEFLQISPNNRMPAIVDDEPADKGAPISIFESGAILCYLAEKTGCLLPRDPRAKSEAMAWLFWQVGGLGPMAGQAGHFLRYAPEKIPYAIDRYKKEVSRLYAVLDHRLADREFLAGEYSIADIAAYPWIVPDVHQQNIDEFPNLKRWCEVIDARPAVTRAYEKGEAVRGSTPQPLDDEAKRILFGQSADTLRRPQS